MMTCTGLIKKQYAWWLSTLLLLSLEGCGFGLGGPSLNSNDPALRIPAIKQAGISHDKKAVPALITSLESHDPAVRFYAAWALNQITGRAFGYVYYEPRQQREAAIERWRVWNSRHVVGGA